MINSLHGRLLIVASLVMAAFLGITALVLDEAFRRSAETSIQERIQARIYSLLAAVDEDINGGMAPPGELPSPRLSQTDSGLYARIATQDGSLNWRSPSLTGRELEIIQPQKPGKQQFKRLAQDGLDLFTINYGIAWEDNQGKDREYTFAIAESAVSYRAEVAQFRITLWRWLGGLALVLLVVQGMILRWGLNPLRTVASDLRKIEQGEASRLGGNYPKELKGLTSNLNSLLEQSRATQTRYRNSLGDLAHSLKTPLALLQSLTDSNSKNAPSIDSELLTEQIGRLNQIVSHQLQRAAASGRGTLMKPVAVASLVERLVRSLDKVYLEKSIAHNLTLDQACRFLGDEADLLEVLGNLIENAYKYCGHQVDISVSKQDRELRITIDDDGPGIAREKLTEVLKRGHRIDETTPGQGIGLSVAHEIITLYDGSLEIEQSVLGGASISIIFK
ncbi:MAG: GHKL domain-containing protein [Gammaproteobacteria bacterium]|nr:GHKL domain-containing protein [Gammaproteobacteria bacterium]